MFVKKLDSVLSKTTCIQVTYTHLLPFNHQLQPLLYWHKPVLFELVN